MSTITPILHVASGTWTLGKIVEHTAKPCSKEEVEAVIATAADRDRALSEMEQMRDEWRNAEQERDATRSELERTARAVRHLLSHCKDAECSACGEIVCKYHDPLHFHHDGCPSCELPPTAEQIGKRWLENSSLEAWFPITAEELVKLRAERDAMREALEEACRCQCCNGTGMKAESWCDHYPCPTCLGTGRDYHGSEKARAILEVKS